MNSVSQRIQPPTPTRFFTTFGYVWFVIGLFTGTLVLVVAVRGIIAIIQKLGWGQSAQDRILIALILVFVAGSFMLARRVVRVLYRQTPRARKIALVALTVPAIASGYAWSNPTRFLAGFAGSTSGTLQMSGGGPTFLFGPYPDDARIRELKQQGVQTIVSLQDPRVLVELQGINEERKSAERAGMKLIQAPMLPWVSDNSSSIAIIKNIALTGKGTYYVHCGLGRDRVNIAKRVIESLEPQSHARLSATSGLKRAEGFDTRKEPFQRGRLFRLAQDVWMIPIPNAAEFYGHIIQGSPGHVVLLLDPADTAQANWMAKAQRDMRQYSITFTSIPTSAGDTLRRAIRPADASATALAALIGTVRTRKPPYTLIVPYTTFSKGPPTQPLQRALLQAFGASGVEGAAPARAADTAARRPTGVAATPSPAPANP